jgi:spore photoproduct lyase
MPSFVPARVLVSRQALDYPLGKQLTETFRRTGTPVTTYDRRVPTAPGDDFREKYLCSKRTLVVMVRDRREFQTCKPSAHYQLPLVSGCPGLCQYCYLNTNLGHAPHIRVYVNVDEILAQAEGYVRARLPEPTVFEGAATSDPISVESYTNSMARATGFFARVEGASFRFVTKYTDVEGLLGVDHRGKTEIRFSVNCKSIIDEYERGVPSLDRRLRAAMAVADAGYPIGFLIAPIFVFDGWREHYGELIQMLADAHSTVSRGSAASGQPLTFELISHRFTSRAKNIIVQVYPHTTLPMDESTRKLKHGQFGYSKYVYDDNTMSAVREFFQTRITSAFPYANILYAI